MLLPEYGGQAVKVNDAECVPGTGVAACASTQAAAAAATAAASAAAASAGATWVAAALTSPQALPVPRRRDSRPAEGRLSCHGQSEWSSMSGSERRFLQVSRQCCCRVATSCGVSCGKSGVFVCIIAVVSRFIPVYSARASMFVTLVRSQFTHFSRPSATSIGMVRSLSQLGDKKARKALPARGAPAVRNVK